MRRRQEFYRRVFTNHHGELPQPCAFCDEPVTKWGRNADEGGIHHLDGDFTNDDPANLAAAHVVCHQRHHIWEHMGDYMRSKPPEVRAKISASLTGKTQSAATRAKRGESLRQAYTEGRKPKPTGRPPGPTSMVPCPVCGRTMKADRLPRHRCRPT